MRWSSHLADTKPRLMLTLKLATLDFLSVIFSALLAAAAMGITQTENRCVAFLLFVFVKEATDLEGLCRDLLGICRNCLSDCEP